MRRLLVTVLLAPMLSVLVLVSTEGAAHACTCLSGTLRAQVRNADVVLVGTVSAVEKTGASSSDASSGSAASSPTAAESGGASEPTDQGGTTTAVVEVEKVYKGEAGERERVTSPTGGGACGVDLVAERRYLIVGAEQSDSISTTLCDGTAVADSRLLKRVARAAGNTGSAPTATTAPTSAELTRVDEADPPTFTRVAAPGAALVIVGFLGLVLARRRGR